MFSIIEILKTEKHLPNVENKMIYGLSRITLGNKFHYPWIYFLIFHQLKLFIIY